MSTKHKNPSHVGLEIKTKNKNPTSNVHMIVENCLR
jgi:hypothetical protein